MSIRIECAGLQVDPEIHALLENEILPGTGLDAATFWRALADIVARFTPRNRELLAIRDDIYGSLRALCFDVLAAGEPEESGEDKIAEWERANGSRVPRARRTLAEALIEMGLMEPFFDRSAKDIDCLIEACVDGFQASIRRQSDAGDIPF